MPKSLTEKIFFTHTVELNNDWLAVKPAQVLLQDATGTLVMQALESIGLSRVKVPLAVQYVDHNLIQADFRNADDHAYLRSAAATFGICFAEPGEGVSHPVHALHFGVPGALLLGSDSHTCAAGALGMIGIGAGSFDVAATLAGRPYALPAPRVRRVILTGKPPPMVGAKDVILTLLGRHGVAGARGEVLEYDGPGVAAFGVMDRMAIANMGAELGATASVFPSDDRTRAFLDHAGRCGDWRPLAADPGARYDEEEELDLSLLEPMIARPGSPANVVPVREVQGTPVGQAYIGSSASPGYADIARVARDAQRAAKSRWCFAGSEPRDAPRASGLDGQRGSGGTGRFRSEIAPGRLQRLQRHGAGPRLHREFAANGTAELPRPVGNGQ